jgi:sRNA-binding carbon storage regulator CsrA
MLKIDLEPGQTIKIGNYATITMEEKSGQRARLAIEADKSIPIHRPQRQQTDAMIAAKAGITGMES